MQRSQIVIVNAFELQLGGMYAKHFLLWRPPGESQGTDRPTLCASSRQEAVVVQDEYEAATGARAHTSPPAHGCNYATKTQEDGESVVLLLSYNGCRNQFNTACQTATAEAQKGQSARSSTSKHNSQQHQGPWWQRYHTTDCTRGRHTGRTSTVFWTGST